MQRVRRDIYSGVVLERIIYSVSDRTQKPYRPRKPRFKTDEERARFNAEVARRAHTRIINENFTPASLYSTLTQDDEHEVHDFKDFRRLCVRQAFHIPSGTDTYDLLDAVLLLILPLSIPYYRRAG